jgi:DNA-binding response OmpR family regulator
MRLLVEYGDALGTAMARRLLICDDNRDLLRFLALELSAAASGEWQVLPAENVASARQILAGQRIDAALIDLWVGQEDGLELAAEVREASPEVRILMMSGASLQVKEDIEALGYEFMAKPFVVRDIIARLPSGPIQVRGRKNALDSLSLLIVDDNRGFLQFVLRIFESELAWTCYVAESAEEAESIIIKRKPDAAIIDCQLPGKSGLELAVALRSAAPQSVVIMISGEWAWSERVEAKGFRFLQKPFRVSDITNYILPSIIEKTKPRNTIELFYSYSHRDEKLRGELDKHLALLHRQGAIEAWYDRKIEAGREFEKSINVHLERADVILLLVSSDFMASEFCYGREMERALERHREEKARVIPVILRPVDWLEAPFRGLQALPSDGRPVTKWPQRDDAFLNITKGIRRVATDLLQHRSAQG